MKTIYKKQVQLLLSILPEVKKESCFALYGGTAINLFVRNMPRLSVDIDLNYIFTEDRKTSLENINQALVNIKTNVEKVIPNINIQSKAENGKLLFRLNEVIVKLEVDLIGRGVIAPPIEMSLCSKAQFDFSAFVKIPVVTMGQLYGGKICAALDRQHPRDLFDIKYLLNSEGFSDEVREGFIFSILGKNRPIHEIIYPNFQNQEKTMQNHFDGMSIEKFSYNNFEEVRKTLLNTIHKKLTKKDKDFLLSIKLLQPDWSIYDFKQFPAIRWKVQNLEKLKTMNLKKYNQHCKSLKEKLHS